MTGKGTCTRQSDRIKRFPSSKTWNLSRTIQTKQSPLPYTFNNSQQNISKSFFIFLHDCKEKLNLSSLFFPFHINLNIWHCLYVWTNLVTLCFEDSMLLFLFVFFLQCELCIIILHEVGLIIIIIKYKTLVLMKIGQGFKVPFIIA